MTSWKQPLGGESLPWSLEGAVPHIRQSRLFDTATDCAGGHGDDIEGRARPWITFQDNLIDPDPGFVDRAARNFQLQDSSPAWKLGFQRLPLERIGIYQADTRASWPVQQEVRRE